MAVDMTTQLIAMLKQPIVFIEEYMPENLEKTNLRLLTLLDENGITTVGDLLQTPKKKLMQIENFGDVYFERVVATIKAMGFVDATPEPKEKKNARSRSSRRKPTRNSFSH